MKIIFRIVVVVLGLMVLNACTGNSQPNSPGVWNQSNWDGAAWQ